MDPELQECEAQGTYGPLQPSSFIKSLKFLTLFWWQDSGFHSVSCASTSIVQSATDLGHEYY